jgi:hypothetical protein
VVTPRTLLCPRFRTPSRPRRSTAVCCLLSSQLNIAVVYAFVPGDLSARALTRSKGIHDAKIPYISPISVSRELVLNTHDRNYVYVELNVEGSVYLLLSKVSRLPPRLSSAADGPSSLPSPFILSGPDWPFLSTVASTLVLISALNHNSYSLPKHSCSEGPNHAAPSTTLLSASRPNTPCSSSHDRNQPSISEHLSTSTGD